jgi:hypothetical protein
MVMTHSITPASAEARRNHLKQQLDRAAEVEGSDARALPGLKDTLSFLFRALRGSWKKILHRDASPR